MIDNYIAAITGGLIVNFYRAYVGFNDPKNKLLFKDLDKEYWAQFILLLVMGVLIVFGYSLINVKLTPAGSIHIGATAPLIAKSLSSSVRTNIDYD